MQSNDKIQSLRGIHCRYKSNDIYLKELIEEWCEGVINENNQKQEGLSSCKRTDLERPHSLLLEKIAVHLQMSTAESPAVDLRGLTKVRSITAKC